VQVVRCFEDEDIHHVTGSVDPVRDIEVVNTELVLADLEAVQKRLEKGAKDAKRGDKLALAEEAVLKKLEPVLDAGKPALTVPLTPEEKAVSKAFFLLTDKPTIFACNVKESELAAGDKNPYVQKVGEYVRFRSSLPPRLNEFAILITARRWSSQYEWFAHHRLAMAAGLDPAVAEAVANRRVPINMKPDEQVVYDFTTELHEHHGVSDATYRRALDAFGERGVADLIAVNGYYVLVAMTVNVDRTPIPGGGTPPLPRRDP